MSERARHLAERVFPEDVRVRQWVSLPFDLRWWAAFDHTLACRLASLLQTAIARRYRRLAREAGLAATQGGAVLVMQRCSSDLRTNLHFHLLSLDGAFGTEAPLAHPAQRSAESPRRRTEGADAPRSPGAPRSHRGAMATRRNAASGDAAAAECRRELGASPDLLRPPLALDRLKILGRDLVAIDLKRSFRGLIHRRSRRLRGGMNPPSVRPLVENDSTFPPRVQTDFGPVALADARSAVSNRAPGPTEPPTSR